MLGLRFCVRAFSSCGERGLLFIAVRGPLTVVASPVAEHRLQTRRLSSCGSRAQLLHSMWDLPRPGLEPVSPALVGRLSTTVPPGKPNTYSLTKVTIKDFKGKYRTDHLKVKKLKICYQRKFNTLRKLVLLTERKATFKSCIRFLF